MAKITLGGIEFPRKGDAEEYLKNMLNRYDVGDKVNAKDSEVVKDTLLLHPDSAEKIGSGILSFSVRSEQFGTQCFWINRTDGSTESFSFRKCLYRPK